MNWQKLEIVSRRSHGVVVSTSLVVIGVFMFVAIAIKSNS